MNIESLIDFFLKLKDSLGWGMSIAIFIVAVTAVTCWKKLIDIAIGLLHSLIQKEFLKFNRNGVLRHPLFFKLKYLEQQRLKFLKCQCPLRKKIFRDLMIIRVKCMDFVLKDFVNNNDIGKYSESECKFKLSSIIYDIFLRWEEESKRAEIPEVVINRLLECIQDIRDGIIAYINTSSNSYSNFNNNYAKVYALLDIISGFEELLIIRLEMKIDSMNGEISNCEYKGIKCEHCIHCQSTHCQHNKTTGEMDSLN